MTEALTGRELLMQEDGSGGRQDRNSEEILRGIRALTEQGEDVSVVVSGNRGEQLVIIRGGDHADPKEVLVYEGDTFVGEADFEEFREKIGEGTVKAITARNRNAELER